MKHVYGVLCVDDSKVIYHLPQKSMKAAKEFINIVSVTEPLRSFYITVCEEVK